MPIAEDDSVGVADVAPTPSDDAEVPPAAALPPEPITPLLAPGVVEPAPVPTLDADIPEAALLPPAAPAVLEPGEAAIADPAMNSAEMTVTVTRLIIDSLLSSPYGKNDGGSKTSLGMESQEIPVHAQIEQLSFVFHMLISSLSYSLLLALCSPNRRSIRIIADRQKGLTRNARPLASFD
jgi:hypothetical protein